MNQFYIQLLVWVVAVGVAFAILWKNGYLARLSAYVSETRDELKKCTWPTRDELMQSTLLIAVVMGSLGVFTMAVDFVVLYVVKKLV